MTLLIKTRTDSGLIPEYSTSQSAGADVRAHINTSVKISPGAYVAVPTGLFFEIPDGYEIQLRPRSGLALKNQITILNTPGTIDSDYRGELIVILINHWKNEFIVKNGMRIAQVVVSPVVRASFVPSEYLSETDRGSGGFGHTGVT